MSPIKSLPLLFVLVSLVFLMPACKSSRTGEGGKLRKKNARSLIKKLDNNRIDAEWLNAKGRISYKSDDLSIRVTTNIRMRKDSIIWMNVKKLSIEAARVLITPDSVYILNRLQKEYAIESFDYIARTYNLPASFAALQDILFGNPVLMNEEADYRATIDGKQYYLSHEQDNITTDYWLNGFSYVLEAMAFSDTHHDRQVHTKLEDYRPLKGVPKFSYVRNLKMKSPDTGAVDVELKFTKVELNSPANTPFSIPSSYSKME